MVNELNEKNRDTATTTNQNAQDATATHVPTDGNPVHDLLVNAGFLPEEITNFVVEQLACFDNKLNGPYSLPLMECMFFGATECLDRIKNPIDPMANKYINIMRNLCNKGFDVNQNYRFRGGIYNNTMLMRRIAYGREIQPTSALLLLSNEFNANPFIKDSYGKNALHFLLLKGHEIQRCIIDAILKRKDIREHINDATLLGDTAMHIACARRDIRCITQLLEKGASLFIKNCDGQAPIDLLHLNEEKRLDFLIRDNQYLDLTTCPGISKRDKLLEVATIDKKIFNSDPYIIKKKIEKKMSA
ncbi:MAG: ankyrin repeat domain-containing protein [Candidatus Cardinium sp.]|nr:MAG: ankyrin repeat domain-containing protein [Candidatus Cardinium sp.]